MHLQQNVIEPSCATTTLYEEQVKSIRGGSDWRCDYLEQRPIRVSTKRQRRFKYLVISKIKNASLVFPVEADGNERLSRE
jgi:hypothetical protein